VISLCAGITTAQMEAQLPDGTPVIRVMPNTPAELGVGMSVISAGAHASEADLARAVSLMEAVGKAVVIPESHQDAATAISGSGPAYIFYVAEALADAGVLLGLPRAVATALATQTLLGSSTLLDASGQHATLLRERVTSPAGRRPQRCASSTTVPSRRRSSRRRKPAGIARQSSGVDARSVRRWTRLGGVGFKRVRFRSWLAVSTAGHVLVISSRVAGA
jgi:hypothetical protein